MLSSHTHAGPMAIGGVLTDGTPGEAGGVSGMSFVNQLSTSSTFRFDHVTLGQDLPVNFADYVYLAGVANERVFNLNHNGGQTQEFANGVWVVDQGGCYSEGREAVRYWDMYDFAPGAQASQNHGRRLVVFLGAGTVGIKGTEDNRQFGLSILAPLAHVLIDETVGYIDGCVTAKSISMTGSFGSNGAGVQFHCNCYNGPMTCAEAAPPPPPCVDLLSSSRCDRFVSRNQCNSDREAYAGCKQTCGFCGGGCPTTMHEDNLHGDPCNWPLMTGSCSLITKDDATLGSHSHYSGLCIGGRLTDSSPSQHGTVGFKSFVTDIGNAASRFHWADGVTTGQSLPFQWNEFQQLADTIQPSSTVIIVQQGDNAGSEYRFDMDDVYGSPNTNHDNSAGHAAATGANLLVVFRGRGTVRITASSGGRPFQGTILAPNAHVILDGSSSYVDGVVIARSYLGEQGMDQMHANLYTGNMMCTSTEAPIDPPTPTCRDSESFSFCDKKRAKGRCSKETVRSKCRHTCDACAR